jgi:glycine betaine/proline transport system ATP-binding protein
MNPLGVLCAADVMEPVTGTPQITVSSETEINAVMASVEELGTPVGVVRDGKLIGQITPDTVLKRLLESKP